MKFLFSFSFLRLLPYLAYKFREPHIPASQIQYVQELTVALPLAIINLTNATQILRDGNMVGGNITFRASDFGHDVPFVMDKAAGFYAILDDVLSRATDGNPCFHEDLRSYMACIVAASCVIQAAVPAHVSMEVYAMILEQVTRFEEITWPLLRDALDHEEGSTLASDILLPEAFVCDGSEHDPSFLQLDSDSLHEASLRRLISHVGTEHTATVTMALALREAAANSHQILDSHATNGSLDDTIEKLQHAWHPACQQLGCDHTNFWDIYLQHHKHSMAVFKTNHAGLLRSDIKLRFHLEQRVQRFMADTQDYSFIEKYARHGKEQHSSHQHFYGYHNGARAAMLAFASPVVKSLPYERAKRLVDLHKLDDIKKSREARRLGSEEPAVPDEKDGTPLSLVEEAEEVAEGDEGKVVFWDRRRDRRRRRRVFEAVVKVVEDVAKEVEKVVEDVAKAVESAFSCAGQGGTFAATGYTRSINGNVAWSIGLSAGPENVFQELLSGKLPLGTISLGAGFSVGSTTDIWWAGAGFGGSITCKAGRGMFGIKKPGQCKLDMTVATLACGNVPTSHSACPMGRNFAGMTCSSAGGYAVSIMCCTFDLSNGKNNCCYLADYNKCSNSYIKYEPRPQRQEAILSRARQRRNTFNAVPPVRIASLTPSARSDLGISGRHCCFCYEYLFRYASWGTAGVAVWLAKASRLGHFFLVYISPLLWLLVASAERHDAVKEMVEMTYAMMVLQNQLQIRRRLPLLALVVAGWQFSPGSDFTGARLPEHNELVLRRAQKEQKTQAYNEIASVEVSEKEKSMKGYMSPEDVAAELIRRREEQLENYMSGVDLEQEERSDRSISSFYWLFVPVGIGLALTLYYLNITYSDFKERSVGLVSYADVCGSDAFELKQLFFPNAECVEPLWKMTKEEFEDSQRQAEVGVGSTEKKLPKTAQQILKELQVVPRTWWLTVVGLGGEPVTDPAGLVADTRSSKFFSWGSSCLPAWSRQARTGRDPAVTPWHSSALTSSSSESVPVSEGSG
ncbi:unnamed protein product [Symbiodinium sp. CCMP2456]|nr:unnamed protein product [Symbiodinium sp. CCMP2456]